MSEYVTQGTFDKMREELQRMKAIDRPAASKAIGEAREKGDLKENAEYDSAKEAQGMLEALQWAYLYRLQPYHVLNPQYLPSK